MSQPTYLTPSEIAALVDEIGWSVTMLARKCGVRDTTARRWLNGKRVCPPPFAAVIQALAEAHRANPFPPNDAIEEHDETKG